MAVLDEVPDPEIPAVSVPDLGIVRGSPTTARRSITPTYSGCPATAAIEQAIRDALDAAGFTTSISIETLLSPPWTTDWISERGKAKLPPTASPRRPRQGLTCPQCGSTETEEVSRFGSTPCKAQWRCNPALNRSTALSVISQQGQQCEAREPMLAHIVTGHIRNGRLEMRLCGVVS